MRMAIGADHGGVELKDLLAAWLREQGHDVYDVGTDGPASVDYPDYAQAVTGRVADGRVDRGVLVCGTGIGMSIAANKVPGVRAALVGEPYSARLAAEHNNAQVLCMGGRVTGPELAVSCLVAWLGASFEGGRHARRVGKLEA